MLELLAAAAACYFDSSCYQAVISVFPGAMSLKKIRVSFLGVQDAANERVSITRRKLGFGMASVNHVIDSLLLFLMTTCSKMRKSCD